MRRGPRLVGTARRSRCPTRASTASSGAAAFHRFDGKRALAGRASRLTRLRQSRRRRFGTRRGPRALARIAAALDRPLSPPSLDSRASTGRGLPAKPRGRDRLRPERASRARSRSRGRARGRGARGRRARRRRSHRGADAARVPARRLLRDPPARPRVAVLPRRRARRRLGRVRRRSSPIRSTTAPRSCSSATSPTSTSARTRRRTERWSARSSRPGRRSSRCSSRRFRCGSVGARRPCGWRSGRDARSRDARSLAESRFATERAPRALRRARRALLPSARAPPTAGFGLGLAILAHVVGWAFPRGGAQAITDALVALAPRRSAAPSRPGPVDSLPTPPDRRPPRRHAAAAAPDRGDRLPPLYRRQLGRYRYGPGVFKLDWALDAPVPWRRAGVRAGRQPSTSAARSRRSPPRSGGAWRAAARSGRS